MPCSNRLVAAWLLNLCIYTTTPSEPLEYDPFRLFLGYTNLVYIYIDLLYMFFPTVQIANGPLLFFQDLYMGGQLQQADCTHSNEKHFKSLVKICSLENRLQ